MSDTPRTDSATFDWTASCRGEAGDKPALVVDADFARTLERELADAKAAAGRLVALIGDETAAAAKLHTEAQRVMAPNEREFAAVYVAMCTLRDRARAVLRERNPLHQQP